MKYTQSILVACAGAAILASARPAVTASDVVQPRSFLTKGAHKAGKAISKTASVTSAVDSTINGRDLEDLDIRGGGRGGGGGRSAGRRGGHGGRGGRRGQGHSGHHGSGGHQHGSGGAGAGSAAAAQPEEQPAARDFDEEDLLFLRDFFDGLEERSEFEDVMFPRDFEFEDELEARATTAKQSTAASKRPTTSASKKSSSAKRPSGQHSGSAKKTTGQKHTGSQAHRTGSAAAQKHKGSQAHSGSQPKRKGPGLGEQIRKQEMGVDRLKIQKLGQEMSHEQHELQKLGREHGRRGLDEFEDDLDLRSFDDFEVDELD